MDRPGLWPNRGVKAAGTPGVGSLTSKLATWYCPLDEGIGGYSKVCLAAIPVVRGPGLDVSDGHEVECHELLPTGVELDHQKADRRGHPLSARCGAAARGNQ